jgi:hypothetical protein
MGKPFGEQNAIRVAIAFSSPGNLRPATESVSSWIRRSATHPWSSACRTDQLHHGLFKAASMFERMFGTLWK